MQIHPAKAVFLGILFMVTSDPGRALAQDFSEFGMHRPMTPEEVGRYGQCQQVISSTMSTAVIGGRQLTYSEALGPALSKRMCACQAVRMHGGQADFDTAWTSCLKTIIGP